MKYTDKKCIAETINYQQDRQTKITKIAFNATVTTGIKAVFVKTNTFINDVTINCVFLGINSTINFSKKKTDSALNFCKIFCAIFFKKKSKKKPDLIKFLVRGLKNQSFNILLKGNFIFENCFVHIVQWYRK